jgi:hypothetical protein
MKKASSFLTALLIVINILPIFPAHGTSLTMSEIIYSSETSDEALKDFNLPGDAANIQVTVNNNGEVLSHGRNANGTYRVHVGKGNVTTIQTLYKDVDQEHKNIRTREFNAANQLIQGAVTYSWNNSDYNPTVAYNVNGYTGTLIKWMFTEATEVRYTADSKFYGDTVFTGFYKGTVSKQATVHEYTVTITYTSSNNGPVTPPPPAETPVVLTPSMTYTVETDDIIYVPVRVVNSSSIAEKSYTVHFCADELSLISTGPVYSAEGAALTTTVSAAGNFVNVSGSMAIPGNHTWTGVLFVLAFLSLTTGIVTVSVS